MELQLFYKKMKISKFRDDPKVSYLTAQCASEIQNVLKTSHRRGGLVVERLPRTHVGDQGSIPSRDGSRSLKQSIINIIRTNVLKRFENQGPFILYSYSLCVIEKSIDIPFPNPSNFLSVHSPLFIHNAMARDLSDR